MINIKKIVSIIILFTTLVLFAWYISNNRYIINNLSNISLFNITLLLITFSLVTACNALILVYSLAFIKRSIPTSDSLLLTGYSSVINFFGPLQSGPGYRAIVLNKKFGITYREFIKTSLVFYFFVAAINLFILLSLSATQGRNVIFISLVLLISISAILLVRLNRKLWQYINKFAIIDSLLNKDFWKIGFATTLLTLFGFFTHFIELRLIDPSLGISQILGYSAAGNMALFFSITPGGIGIKEGFIYFTQQIHHITTDQIVAASLIDRGVYVIFLLTLFISTIFLHVKEKFNVRNEN